MLHDSDRIATADSAAAHYGGIDTDIDLVMLGRRAEDSRIFREISLRESGHYAARARASDAQANFISDRESAAHPAILREALLT
jgi:hypothetical protein